ncbi:unnamed protein product [marine sediment metagenome]|uniref:Uncharacterized protein n=1 Tax=marine sediment metagenome TaxID=412755 RepID=X1AM61_9ZZZZ
METKILVTVKTGPTMEVYPEEGKYKKDFTKEELKICNDDYKKELHAEVVKNVKYALEKLKDEDELIEESYIEGSDDWEEDYGIEITTEVQ